MNDENHTPRSLYVAIGIVMLLLVIGLLLRLRSELKLRHVRELQQALRQAPPEERATKFQELRDSMRSLPQRERDRMMADGRKRFEDEIIRYTKLSQAEKRKYLDDRIDRSERFRQNGGPGRPDFGGGRRNGGLSQEERDRRRKQRLDQTTPEFRSAMDQFRRDMENRRRQRGLK
jgi:hypothetical protein